MRLTYPAAIALALTVAACGGGGEVHDVSPEESACFDRGLAYYTDLGTYPILIDGKYAVDVVRARCHRFHQAF